MASSPDRMFLVFLALVPLLAALGFGALTVTVNQSHIAARFGLFLFRGWFTKRILLEDGENHQLVRNNWWYGFGIKYIGQGWLYNISGLDAVEFQLRNGRRVRIGSDEAERLVWAVTQAHKSSKAQPPHSDSET